MNINKRKSLLLKINNKLDYKDTDILKNFLNDQGKILPRKSTGLSSKQQKHIAKAIKNARIVSLLTFLANEE
nr:ribosomal protein S18 [Cavernulicola chilensis]